jgi:hypothetical protein
MTATSPAATLNRPPVRKIIFEIASAANVMEALTLDIRDQSFPAALNTIRKI